ncbi:MAG: S8 family serine peptidase [Pseudomonadota bacterium]
MIKRTIHLTITLFFIIPLFVFFPSISPSQDATDEIIDILRKSPKLDDADLIFKDFFEGKARTRVMVGMRKPAKARSMQKNLRNMEAREQLKQAAQATQKNVISTLDQNEVRISNTYNYIFGFAAEVTRQGLQDLIDTPDVMFIEKDKIVYAHLAQGIPLMNASTTRSTYNGSGLAIAICDTGIDYTHSKLGNGGFPNSKVIGGYDFGDNDSNPMDLEGHGTACAGIAAGDLGTVGDYIGGVAYGAKLYALKISFGATGDAYLSDMANAWDWCILHQYDDLNNPIMIISTSFGGGRYSGNCDSAYSLLTHAAANAMAAGMTLFLSSGNDGYCDSMGYPACLDSVISVGAVYDANIGRNPTTGYIGCISYGSCVGTPDPDQVCEKLYIDVTTNADQICTYSNSSKFASLLAPFQLGYDDQAGWWLLGHCKRFWGDLSRMSVWPQVQLPVYRVRLRPSLAHI